MGLCVLTPLQLSPIIMWARMPQNRIEMQLIVGLTLHKRYGFLFFDYFMTVNFYFMRVRKRRKVAVSSN